MSRQARNNLPPPVVDDPVMQYLIALEDVYPSAKGSISVVKRPDSRIIVSVPLPARAVERMRLFDRMAEVATNLLLQTGHYIILSASD